MSDIDAILEGSVEEVAAVEEPKAEEPKAESTELENSTDTKGETEVETPEPEAAKPEESIDWKAELEKANKEAAAFKTQALDERRKRQDLEASKTPAPDVLDDPKGYEKHILTAAEQRIVNQKFETSEALLKKEIGAEATQEAFGKFEALAQSNPQLWAEVQKDPLPWQAMHELVNKSERLAEMQDVDAYEAKIRAEVSEKIKAEVKAEVIAELEAEAKKNSIRPSLAGSASAGGVGGATWSGPASLESVLN